MIYFLSIHHYHSRFHNFYPYHWTCCTHFTYLKKSLESLTLRERCAKTMHFLAVYFKSLWNLRCFWSITLWPSKQVTLSMHNFETGIATEEYNRQLERSLLGLRNELSLDSVERSFAVGWRLTQHITFFKN